MTARRLIAVPVKGTPEYDRMVKVGIAAALNEHFAEDVIAGYLIHNVETDEFVLREKATDEFKTAATEAYTRMLAGRDQA